MWIGGTDAAVEGEYKWADGEPFTWPTFLTNSKPANDPGLNCLKALSGNRWTPQNCAQLYTPICEVNRGKNKRGAFRGRS